MDIPKAYQEILLPGVETVDDLKLHILSRMEPRLKRTNPFCSRIDKKAEQKQMLPENQ